MSNFLVVGGTLVLSALAGLLYRLGGVGKPYPTKLRDFGVPACMVGIMTLLGQAHWVLIICYVLMFAALTTYWDFVNKWFKVKDPDTEYWWNWALHGFFVGLAMFPLTTVTGEWTGFVIRQAVVTLATAVWSELCDNVVWEESGRGVIVTLSLPLLLV